MPLRFRILAAPPTASGTAAPGEVAGPSEERSCEVASAPESLSIGRRPDADLSLPFSSVSAHHARLFRGDTEREWWLEDLGSMNGTWLDGDRIQAGRPAALRAGQRLQVGTIELLFEGWSAKAAGDDGTGTLARRLISDLFSSPEGDVPTLAVQGGLVHAEPLRLTVRERRYVAGRADTCDLVLRSEHVSREHAAFVRRMEGVFVRDLGSRNNVRVNGVAISGEACLADGDRIDVGVVVLAFTDPEERYRHRLAGLGEKSGGPSSASRGQVARTGTPTVGLPIEEGAPSRVPRRSSRPVGLIIAGGIVVLAVVGLIALWTTWG